ncbi:MAG: flagellin [Oligoflexus sp.]
MSSFLNDKVTSQMLNRHLNEARRQGADALEKLSSGVVFTKQDPRPADRALAESLEFKLRSLSSSKRNINDAVSLLQVAESGFAEITNILTRMKEINIAGASTTMTDKERRYLFIEYEALHQEIDRIAKTTEYNSIPLLNGEDENVPEQLIFRISDPHFAEGAPNSSGDWNEIRLENLQDVIATTEGLGLRNPRRLLEEERGVTLSQAQDLMEADDSRQFSTVYDEAQARINQYRASYGAMQNRLQQAMSFNEVIEENIAAAKSKIADTDYATEVSNLTRSQILTQATTGLLAQSNFNATLALNLMNNIVR